MARFFSKTLAFVGRVCKKHVLTFILGFIAAILAFVALNAAMVPVSTSEYCGSKCHEMKTAYTTWELSTHGANYNGIRVECVDCHLPSKDDYFTHMAVKAREGARDVYMHYFGPEYDVEKIRKRVFDKMPNKQCLICHNDLLKKPSKAAVRIAHMASLAKPDRPQNKCVKCHEAVGHERINKLISK